MRLKSILFITTLLMFASASANKNFALKTVVIDAGHGGKDPGAIGGNKTNEKDIALIVALKLGDYISKNFPDVNVIYTRKTDVFLELHERAEIANKNKADLFIAIHINSSTNQEAFGTSTYVLGLHRTEANLEVAKRENSVILLEDDRDKNYEFDPNSPEGHIIMSMKQNAFLDQSIDFASKIENQMENYGKRKSLGVKQAGFYVLYKTAMPSLLAEIGFISNPEEEKFLNSVKGQDQIASGLFNAFKDYKQEMDGTPQAIETKTTTVTKTETATVKPVVKETPVASTTTTSSTVKTTTTTVKENTILETSKTKKSIRKPIENTSGGGNSTAAASQKGEVKPIYITASDLDPFDTSSMSSVLNKQTNKPITTTVVKTEVKVVPEKPITEPKKQVTETKTETVITTKTEVKVTPIETKTEAKKSVAESVVESNKSELVAAHKSESGTIFKIQLFALKGELKDYTKVSKLFSTLSAEDLPSGITRYYGGNVKSFMEAKKLLEIAKAAGYPAAYIVGYKDGVRMGTDQLKGYE